MERATDHSRINRLSPEEDGFEERSHLTAHIVLGAGHGICCQTIEDDERLQHVVTYVPFKRVRTVRAIRYVPDSVFKRLRWVCIGDCPAWQKKCDVGLYFL